jgi:phosphoribosylformimino-5-aminoimidazole carboxamide ribotide isomerase
MIEIIPAIDIIEGKCVRLQKGDYLKKTIYNEDPVEVARTFEDAGMKRLHLVDLDGAKAKHVVNYKILEKISAQTKLVIDFGGGIKSDKDIKTIFTSGAGMVTIGSIAVTDPDLFFNWLDEYGRDKIILGADVKDNKIAISGWLDKTAIELQDFLETYIERGVRFILCTDISKDGMLQGTSIELYKKLKIEFPESDIIASGGITNIEEIEELEKTGIYGAIIGKSYYEGKIKLEELRKFIRQ